MEEIIVYLKGRVEPIVFIGRYVGHERPDGNKTENWHYYHSEDGKYYHFRKDQIQLVISRS